MDWGNGYEFARQVPSLVPERFRGESGHPLDGRLTRMIQLIIRSLAVASVGLLATGCALLPGNGPYSEAVNANATAGIRSDAPLPYALVDVSSETIGFLSEPNLVSLKGA